MKPRVAVEGSLTNIARDLRTQGYEVVDLNSNEIQNVNAVVVSGEDNNVMNMADIKTKATVINARGMTAEQVRSEIEKRFGNVKV